MRISFTQMRPLSLKLLMPFSQRAIVARAFGTDAPLTHLDSCLRLIRLVSNNASRCCIKTDLRC